MTEHYDEAAGRAGVGGATAPPAGISGVEDPPGLSALGSPAPPLQVERTRRRGPVEHLARRGCVQLRQRGL